MEEKKSYLEIPLKFNKTGIKICFMNKNYVNLLKKL